MLCCEGWELGTRWKLLLAPLLGPCRGLSDSSKSKGFRVSVDLQHGWENHPKTQKKSEVFLVLVLTETSELQGGNQPKPGNFWIHGCGSGC